VNIASAAPGAVASPSVKLEMSSVEPVAFATSIGARV
jgi:hypothetical protein